VGIKNRRHQRAKVKCHVVIAANNDLVDGETQNLSLGGAFIRFSEEPSSNHNLNVVINAKGRFISCTAQVVWSNNSIRASSNKSIGVGVRFTKMMLNDRSFLHGEITNASKQWLRPARLH